jgi:hypothetical protein
MSPTIRPWDPGCAYFLFPDFMVFYGDSDRDLITIWDPGVCIELSTEGLQSEFVEQHSSCEDHFGKYYGVEHQCILYIFRAKIVWRAAHHLSYCVLDVRALLNQLSEIQGTCQKVLEIFMARSASTAAILLFDGSAVICQVHKPAYLWDNWIQDLATKWFNCLNIKAAEQGTYLQRGHQIGVQGSMFLHLIELQQKIGEWCVSRMMFPMCTSSCNIGITTCQVFAHFASWRLYIYLPWDLGISKQVIREGILSELVAVTLVDTVRPRILCRNADLCLLCEGTLIQIIACKALLWEYAMCG